MMVGMKEKKTRKKRGGRTEYVVARDGWLHARRSQRSTNLLLLVHIIRVAGWLLLQYSQGPRYGNWGGWHQWVLLAVEPGQRLTVRASSLQPADWLDSFLGTAQVGQIAPIYVGPRPDGAPYADWWPNVLVILLLVAGLGRPSGCRSHDLRHRHLSPSWIILPSR